MTLTRPSATHRGGLWLENFIVEDRETARVLLDSIRLATVSNMRLALINKLDEMASTGGLLTPALLVPAQALEDLEADDDNDEAPRPHVAFRTFNLADRISATPGSEGWVGNVVRDVVRGDKSGNWLAPETSLKELKSQRCRSIVLLTDFTGSGRQIADFGMALCRNPTLRSWRSGNLISIHVVAFAATDASIARFSDPRGPIDYMHHVELAPSLRHFPFPGMKTAVIDLCRRYARPKGAALGFNGSGGLFASDASAPNNLPIVLRQNRRGWEPFFEGRLVPPDLARELGDYATRPDLSDMVAASGQTRLAASSRKRGSREWNNQLSALLGLTGSMSTSAIAGAMGIQPVDLHKMLHTLSSYGLVTPDGKLTVSGRKELDLRKRADRRVTANLRGKPNPYYPKGMR